MTKFATLDQEPILSAKLKVLGVGGGGCNAIESMMNRGLSGVEYVAINTDAQVLKTSHADHKIQIGTNLTKGLGAGADPNVGKKALEEDREKIQKILEGSDMVFITAGMGGGTGTGAAPIIASIAKSVGALVIGIVTKPFKWEGKKRMLNAENGISEMRQYVDSLIVIPNERILNVLDDSAGAFKAFDKPNEVLHEATRGIADIITIKGQINVDFADVRSVMNHSGEALMGCGIASGENRAEEAAQKAISSPLLEGISIKGAKNILLNVTASSNLTMKEIIDGNQVIHDAAGEESNIIFGLVQKEEMNEYVSYTVIATGFNASSGFGPTTKSNETEKSKNSKSESKDGFLPFILDDFKFDADADFEVPTYKRMNKNFDILSENDKTHNAFNFESRIEKPAKKSDDEKDSDSSDFLRMMMD
ncbi:MAG: cell division protein FtsZ [Ignavibacteriales bacterium CG18_big_fil_WC_8_21_14_2_50_31_20]|nr:MAG: cell division protein FtsZ [Ignavibacteriales bacterium CG18_big_fil_WC_8_21_14_2_50_31_20]